MYSWPLKISERRYLLGLFLNSLKDEVRAELKLHSFHTLEQSMNLDEMVESRNNLLLKSNAGGVGKIVGSQVPSRFGGNSFQNRGSAGVTNTGFSGMRASWPRSLGRGYRQLSEYKEKRLKGLCFACDERYTLDHVCKNKHFKFLNVEEEPDIGVEPKWQDAVEDLGGAMNSL